MANQKKCVIERTSDVATEFSESTKVLNAGVDYEVVVTNHYARVEFEGEIARRRVTGWKLHSWNAVHRPGFVELQFIAVFERGEDA